MIEILETLLANVPIAAIGACGAGVVRCAAGWAKNSFADGKVTGFELKQLGATIVTYFGGITLLSLGVDPVSAVAGTFVLVEAKSALAK